MSPIIVQFHSSLTKILVASLATTTSHISQLLNALSSLVWGTKRFWVDMKIKYHSSWLPLFAILIIISLFIDPSAFVSSAPNDTQGTCVLNFTTYPYVKFGECGSVQENITNWGGEYGFPTTICCRNALTVLSEAMASHARRSIFNAPLFITQDQWQNCSNLFHPQQGMSQHSCGFDDIYLGSTKCSYLTLPVVKAKKEYQDALDKCGHFDQSFDQACANCTSAILSLRDSLYEQENGKESNDNKTERAMCGVAALVALAAGKLPDDPSISDKFLRCMPTSGGKSGSSLSKLMFNVLIAVVVILVIVILVKYIYVSNKKKPKKPVYLKQITTWSGLYWFSKAEIENALNYGNEKVCLGRGSAGQVYRGVLPSGQVVAIKHLIKSNTSDSFTREVEGLSRLRHPNLVSLFGCCIENDERYLVYEFCANGNLAQHLMRRDRHLTWVTRVRILRDCSFALKYLHHHIEGCVVHRDIKLSNILLTENYQAKLSDFGLAKMMGMEESKVFTDVRGTIGYMDPEYMSNAKLTCASDVYSFGIVVLQILSGQKVIELDLDVRDQLTRKARDVSMGKRPISDFEDPRINGEINKVDFEAILHIAVLCVAKSSKSRPTIEVVYEELSKVYNDTISRMDAKQD